MAFDIGSVVATLKADISDFKKGLDQAEDKMKTASGKIGSVATNMAGAFVGFAKRGALSLGAAGVAATAFSVKSAASFEQTRIAIETMVGSADNARKLLKNLSIFAAQTPFEFPELAATTKQLLAFGISQEEVMKQLKMLGNFSAGLGVPLSQLAFTFGQVRVAGRLMGQDLNQFINAGVPIIELLANTLKKPQTEIKKLVEEGKVGFKDVEAAMSSLAGEGGKWSSLMDKQSASLEGRWSTLKDTFGEVGRTLVGLTIEGDIVKGGFFDKITTAAQVLIDWLSQNKDEIIAMANSIINNLAKAGEIAIGLFGKLVDEATKIWGWIVKNRDAIEATAAVIGFALLPQLTALTAQLVLNAAKWVIFNVVSLAQAIANTYMFVTSGWQMVGVLIAQGVQLTFLAAKWVAHNIAAAAAFVMAGNLNGAWLLSIARMGLLATWQGIVTAAQWAWNVAMSANPIGLIIIAIAALVAGIAVAIKYWDKIREAALKAIQPIIDIVKKAIDTLKGLNPFQRNSPSLVDNVTRGVDAISRQFQRLETGLNITPVAAAATLPGGIPSPSGQTIINQYNTINRETDLLAAAREVGFEIGRR